MVTRHSMLMIASAILLFAIPVVGASGPHSASSGRSVERTASPDSRTTVIGTAWTSENTPVKEARVRLREVTSGKVERRALTNASGQFAFTEVEPGTYLVEMVNDAERVIAVGQTFAIAQSESVATFVRLATKVPWFAGFFGNTAAAVAFSAAGEGITALAPVGRPASSGR